MKRDIIDHVVVPLVVFIVVGLAAIAVVAAFLGWSGL